MNAGCYGSQTWEVVEMVLTIARNGTVLRRTPQDFEIGYRHVVLKAGMQHEAQGARQTNAAVQDRGLAARAEEFFGACWFRFLPGDGEEARRLIKEFLQRRIATQPLEQPNAGSVFRNPPNDYAARLIESCGLKGFAIGGAMVSPKHANFIVNSGTASAADIEALIAHVQKTVQERTGVVLEPEVRIIGEPR
jgi:UDP-N-acetylmuramate dehydrogenase